ncbi:ATP-binding cassette domain-containing protein [Streptomyces sp. NPDC006879]|uniref:ATP-binding cassette domain-containing protein n=1 Tax=Streptomyces sp. NPDC006879 TaxID=3364767 RepID=UPI00367F160A
MLQAIGLTSAPRRDRPPMVDDLTLEARPGTVTALLGARGAGKTTVLRMMLELEPGRGVTYFRGRQLHRVAHPGREVGVLLGDVPGHPSRTARGQLRMLCAAGALPVSRADEMLELVGLAGLRDQSLASLSLGMDRRLGLAAALLADPCTLLLDEPAAGLSPREQRWMHGLLRAHAARGGTVLFTTDDSREAARTADHVVSIAAGRLVADQTAEEFARTRLRSRVEVRTPHAVRLAEQLSREARAARRSVEVVREGGNRLAVYGASCGEIGESAYRSGILIHQLSEETSELSLPAALTPAPCAKPGVGLLSPLRIGVTRAARAARASSVAPPGSQAPSAAPQAASFDLAGPSRLTAQDLRAAPAPKDVLPGSSEVRPAPGAGACHAPLLAMRRIGGPLRPYRYELRRVLGTPTAVVLSGAAVALSVLVTLLLSRTGQVDHGRLLTAWPEILPLPPAALAAGLLGALSFGEEYRYPALAADRGTVPRRLGLLVAKLLVSAGFAVALGALTVAADLGVLRLLYGGSAGLPGDWASGGAGWLGLVIGCAWAGVLASGVFRSTAAGLAAVLAVPVAVVPLVQRIALVPAPHPVAGLPARLRQLLRVQWPPEADHLVLSALRVLVQPVGVALALSLAVLMAAYAWTSLRSRARSWRPLAAVVGRRP